MSTRSSIPAITTSPTTAEPAVVGTDAHPASHISEEDMTNTNGQGTDYSAASPPEVVELQADIERTREELAKTVDLLTAKLDVKSRVRDQVSHTVTTTKETAAHQLQSVRDRATDSSGRPTPVALGTAGAIVSAVAAVVLVRFCLGSERHQKAVRRRTLSKTWSR
jgi:hypothetical protein